MIDIKITENQFNNLVKCLDIVLKNNGLASLGAVVELHNVFMDAKTQAEKRALEKQEDSEPVKRGRKKQYEKKDEEYKGEE